MAEEKCLQNGECMRSSYLNNIIYTLIYAAPATLIAIVLHEYAHAVVSYMCGDKNVKSSGRLSLNPFKHLDPLGTLCLLIFHMGWAKPVMVNTASYKHKKLDFCLVALAGPLMNFIIAFISLIGMYFTARYTGTGSVSGYFYYLFYYISMINVGLGVFNLIPIPPLDGSNVLFSLLPVHIEREIRRYSRYFPLLLLILIWFGSFNNILSYVDSGIINWMWRIVLKIFGYPAVVGTV